MATESRPARRLHPLRQPRFRVFLAGHFASLVGDHLYLVALPWAALQQGASAGTVGVLLAAAMVPRVLLMLGGGVVVDWVGSRKVILSSDFLRMAIMAGAALAAFTDRGGIPVLLAVSVLFGVVDAFFYPGVGAFVPSLVPEEALPAANSLRTLALRLAQFLGPPVGGVLMASAGVGWVFVVNAATFAVSFVAVRAVKVAHQDPARSSGPGGAPGAASLASGARRFWDDLVAGLRYVAGNRLVLVLLVVAALANVGFAAPANVGLPLLADHRQWGSGGLGLLLGGLGAGAALGAAVMGFGLFRLPRAGVLLLAATAVQTLCTAATPFIDHMAWAVAVVVLLGLSMTFAGTSMTSMVQAATDRAMLGRVTSLMFVSLLGLTPLAYALGGAAVAWFGAAFLFVAGAVLQACGLAVGLTSASLRRTDLRGQQTPSQRRNSSDRLASPSSARH